jgi:hypothetical protein
MRVCSGCRVTIAAVLLFCVLIVASCSAAPFTAESFHAFASGLSALDAPDSSAFGPSSIQVNDVGAFTDTIQSALNLVEWSQQNVTTPFFPPFSWQKLSGIYPSYVKLNFVGPPTAQLMRDLIGIYDNNGFVTMWILQIMLEAHKFGVLTVTDEVILYGLNLTLGFKERDDDDETPTQDFWQEVIVNGTYQQYPVNVAGPIQLIQPVAAMLQKWCNNSPAICPIVEPFVQFAASLTDFLSAFGIPADFDDSGVNLSLGALLNELRDQMPESWALWNGSKPNRTPKGLMDKFLLYAYRPFSTDIDQNSIDPRTYFWLRAFLAQEQTRAEEAGLTPNLMLITTWADNITSTDEHFYDHHKMPFNTNNSE